MIPRQATTKILPAHSAANWLQSAQWRLPNSVAGVLNSTEQNYSRAYLLPCLVVGDVLLLLRVLVLFRLLGLLLLLLVLGLLLVV